MLKDKKQHLHKFLVRQRDYSDCGVACLATIINFYGGKFALEKLRDLSGTSNRGATFLGLRQASIKSGFESDGFAADIPNLKNVNKPTILHVAIDNVLLHYVVCFGYSDGKFL